MDRKKIIRSALAPAFGLTPQMWKFVEVYFSTLDVHESSLAADVSAKMGREWLLRSDIQGALQQAATFRSSRTAIYADDVLRRWHQMATADVNDLVEFRKINCRHCHGYDNRYQFTKDELRRAQMRHQMRELDKPERKRREFDDGSSLSVHSLFYTLQGEGPYSGHPAVFIRLAGCNLQCPKCFGVAI